jgi:hypothetical protein
MRCLCSNLMNPPRLKTIRFKEWSDMVPGAGGGAKSPGLSTCPAICKTLLKEQGLSKYELRRQGTKLRWLNSGELPPPRIVNVSMQDDQPWKQSVFASLGVFQLTRHDRSSISSACLFTTPSRASSLTRVYSVRSSPAVISGSNNVYSIALVSDVVVQDVIPIFWLDPPVGLLGVLLDKASHRLVVAAGVHA